ncbi:MAG: FG-GAP-like repeat-containing protein [Actinomycetota bacterium]
MDQIVLGGHSAGFNTSSTGVVVLGDFTTTTPPAAALEAVAQVIAWKLVEHQVDPRSTVPYTTTGSSKYPAGTTLRLRRVVAHRDLQTTTCPGSQLYSRMDQIRARVAELAAARASEAPSGLVSLRHPSTGLTDALQFRPGSGGDLWWRATGTGTVRRAAASVNGTFHAVSGDFDGNGWADVLWHGRGSAPDWIWWSSPGGIVSQPVSVSGSYLPVVGDFDGDEVDDVLWYGPGPNMDSVWRFRRDRTHRSTPVTQELLTARPVAGDFDGDGLDDVLWYGPGGGADDEIWHSTGAGFSTRGIRVSGYYQPIVASVDGDAAQDVAWVSESGTGSSVWEFAPEGTYRSRPLPDSSPGARPATGDLDGDGFDDLLVHAAGPAGDAIWYMAPGTTSAVEVSVRGTYW